MTHKFEEERDGMSQQEVADVLGITRERVRQIEYNGLRKLARFPGVLREFVSSKPKWNRCACNLLTLMPDGDECSVCLHHRQYAAKRNRQG
jgi:transcriptional regulator with XRE-family HTH domain